MGRSNLEHLQIDRKGRSGAAIGAKLRPLMFTGMVTALADQMATPDIDDLAFEEHLGTRSLQAVSSDVVGRHAGGC